MECQASACRSRHCSGFPHIWIDVYKRQVMLLVSKLTAAAFTPFREATAFSTCAEQAEQLMPVTTNFSLTIEQTVCTAPVSPAKSR